MVNDVPISKNSLNSLQHNLPQCPEKVPGLPPKRKGIYIEDPKLMTDAEIDFASGVVHVAATYSLMRKHRSLNDLLHAL